MTADRHPQSPAYELFILGLSIYVIFALAIEALAPLDSGSAEVIRYVDTAICVVFLGDFVRNLIRAPNRSRYFVTWGWIDLLSSVPFVGPLRIGRAARVVRIIRVLRGFRSVRNLVGFLLQRRAQAAFATAALVSILLVVFSSIAVLQFEPAAEGSNIRTPQDALWWAYVTLTTVGYGDRFPVTDEGRIIAAILMTAGVGLFGTFTAFVANWFITAPASPSTTSDEGATT